MKKYVKNAVKSAPSKPLRGRRYRRLLSIGVSTLLSVSTFLTIFPQMSVPVYAAGMGKDLQLGSSVLADGAGENSAATVYYGKNDRTWRVIGYPGGEKNAVSCANCVTLLSSQIIGNSRFHSNTGAETDNDYYVSALKTAVNNICSDTYFSTEEQNAIEKRELTVDEYKNVWPYSDGVSGTPLTGAIAPKLWPLSSKEADTLHSNAGEVAGISATWWLRSPGDYDYKAAYVSNDGYVYHYGRYVYNDVGVRPAFNINLSSIILTSAANGGKSSGTTGAGALTAPDNYTGNEWKLTVNDTSRSDFAVNRLGSGKIAAGGNMRFNYSGAKKADNEYVSAILLDESGSLLAYGRIVNTSSSTSGTSYITLPSTLVTIGNTYTLQFISEQYHTDKSTDYSSLPSSNSITFTAGKGTPTAVDFNVELPTDTTYDGSQKSATVTAETGVSGMGNITVKYKDTDNNVSTSAPTDLGTYQILLDVAAGTYYDAADNITDDDWTFTISTAGTVATPTFSPAAGTYSTAQNVAILCTTDGATIHYTTDGTTPTSSSPTYSSAINVDGNMTIKAIAVKTGMADSDVALAEYTIHTHSYIPSVTKEPTCTLTGTRTYTCSCGASYTETIPALGHNYVGTVTKEPTLFTEGIRTYKCSRCDSSYTESIPKLEPSSEEEAKEVIQLLEDLTDEDGKLKADIDVTTETKDDGSTVTTITIGDQEVEKIITDEDGDEMIETNIWTLGGDEEFIYTGAAIKPEVHVYDGISRLSEGSDYKVKYANNKNAGDKTAVSVSFTGGYSGTKAKKVNFTIKPADLTADVVAEDITIGANGKAHKPVPVITLTASGIKVNDQLKYRYLDSEGKEVKDLKEAGIYTFEAKAKKNNKNLTGVLSAQITLTEDATKLLSEAIVTIAPDKYVYTGKPIEPESCTLTLNGETLVEGTDYEVADVKDNTEPGKATIIFGAIEGNGKGITGKKKAAFTITKGFELKPQGEGSPFIYTYEAAVPYKKSGARPEVTVKNGDITLVKDKDYTVSYSKNTKITQGATATAAVKGKGNYKGNVTLYYEVTKQDISTLSSNIIVDDKTESKKGYENPTVTITEPDGKKLKVKKDFNITNYTEPDEKGIVTAVLNGAGSYTGSVPISYRYIKSDQLLSKVNVSKIANKTYTGRELRLTNKELKQLLYKVDKKTKETTYLIPGTDFEIVNYSNNIKKGTASVTLRGLGSHAGTRVIKYKIVSAKRSIIDILLRK